MNLLKKLLNFSILLAFFSFFVLVYTLFDSYYPFHESKIISFPTEHKIYHPGDRVVFELNICVDDEIKFDEVTFQLEREDGSQIDFIVLGSFKSIGRKGCYQIRDMNTLIPSDLFRYSKPGLFNLYVISHSAQNPHKYPNVYKTTIEIQ